MKLRSFLLGLAVLTLIGCEPASFAKLPLQKSPEKNETADIRFGNINLPSPKGYCFNPNYSQRVDGSVFALFSACNETTPQGIFSVSIRRAPTNAVISSNEFERYFTSPQGRASVGAGLTSNRAKIISSITHSNIFYLEIESQTTPDFVDGSPVIWRSFFGQGGSIFVVSFYPLKTSKLSSRQSYALLRKYAQTVRTKN